jgi:CxxC-x17-CxxC domain-containing protein
MVATDKTLICRECGNPFVFTAGEQAFYAERGFVEPSRCPACRANRRAGRQAAGGNSDAFSGARSSGGQGSQQPRELHPAICADCGRETMVPFQPRAGRPVYCRECFNRHRNQY